MIVHAEGLIDKILNLGGMTKAIENGLPAMLIEGPLLKNNQR